MKISLNFGDDAGNNARAKQEHMLEQLVLATQNGDWSAKNQLGKAFQPLLKSLAQKLSQDSAAENLLIEAGKQGLFKAVKKYKKGMGLDKFELIAVNYIESAMNKQGKGGGGFLSRLLGGK